MYGFNWGNLTTEQKLQRDRSEINLLMEQAAFRANQASAIIGGNSKISDFIEFVVSTADGTGFSINTISVSAPTRIQVDWGDGNEGTYDVTSNASLSNTLLTRAEPYTIRVTFDDISLVTQLIVANNSANVTEARGLQKLVNVDRIEIDNNALTSIDVSGLTNLTNLDVSDCVIPGSGGTKSLTSVNLSGCTALTTLYLDGSNFSTGRPNISGLTNLLTLDMDQCGIAGAIDIPASLTSLASLDLSGNAITLITLPQSNLINVRLQGNALTEEAVDHVLEWLDNSEVENGYVNLSDGTNAVPSSTGSTAKTNLEGKGWEVIVNLPPPGYVGIAPSTDFNIVGDFTIEMFVKFTSLNGNQRPYSFGTYPAANAISFEGGGSVMYFWGNNAYRLDADVSLTVGQWYHICVMRASGQLGMYLNGVRLANASYADDIPSQGLPLTIGYGNEPSSEFNGFMSNFRWSAAAEYTASGFTVPTSDLAPTGPSKLLIFQGPNLQSLLTDFAVGKTVTNSGATFDGTPGNPFNSGAIKMGNI
jgi:hypothetical protein